MTAKTENVALLSAVLVPITPVSPDSGAGLAHRIRRAGGSASDGDMSATREMAGRFPKNFYSGHQS